MGKFAGCLSRLDWLTISCWSLCALCVWSLRQAGERPEALVPAWAVTSYLAVVASTMGPSGKWRVLSSAIAVSVTPLQCDEAFLARTLLVVAAVYFAHMWPHRSPVSGWTIGMCLWPYEALVSYRSGWTTPEAIDVVTLFLVGTAVLHVAIRGFKYGRRLRTYVLAFGTMIAAAIWAAMYTEPSPLTVAVAYAPLYATLAVPIWLGARANRGRALVTAGVIFVLLTI